MQGPALLPEELTYTTTFQTEKELFLALIQKPSDFLTFFESACADETWSEAHLSLMRHFIRWGAKQFYLNHLSLHHAKRMTAAIQEHLSIFQPLLLFRASLFFTVTLHIQNEPILVNSLLFGTISSYFSDLFRRACFDKMRNEVVLKGVNLANFRLIEEHILKGHIEELWRQGFSEIVSLMNQAKAWALPKLVRECEGVLKRYINKENVIKTLLKAHQSSFEGWKRDCQELINQLEWGFRCLPGKETDLQIEILDFKEETLERFTELAPYVTHLGFSGHLSEEPYFERVIQQCPRLIGIDLSGSFQYVDQFDRLPPSLTDFNLSACFWLSSHDLRQLSLRFPGIKSLNLNSNLQLDYLSWGELNRFNALNTLKLSNCNQITNEDLRLISRNIPHIMELHLEEDQGFSDRGLVEVMEYCPKLTILNLNYCYHLTDKTLIELGLQAHQLTQLSLMRCLSLTDRGLLQLLRFRPTLRYLNIKYCEFSLKIIEQMRQQYPFIEIID
jgi:hypothetical protein